MQGHMGDPEGGWEAENRSEGKLRLDQGRQFRFG